MTKRVPVSDARSRRADVLQPDPDAGWELWPACLERLRREMDAYSFGSRIAVLTAERDGDRVTILAPTPILRDWLEFRGRPLIEAAVCAEAGRDVAVVFVVGGGV